MGVSSCFPHTGLMQVLALIQDVIFMLHHSLSHPFHTLPHRPAQKTYPSHSLSTENMPFPLPQQQSYVWFSPFSFLKREICCIRLDTPPFRCYNMPRQDSKSACFLTISLGTRSKHPRGDVLHYFSVG